MNQGSTSSAACTACATGSYTSSTGSTTCDSEFPTDRDIFFFLLFNNKCNNNCQSLFYSSVCNAGYFKDTTNTCKDCNTVGGYQPSTGQTSCITCPTGSKTATTTTAPKSSSDCSSKYHAIRKKTPKSQGLMAHLSYLRERLRCARKSKRVQW